jgi:hypothetical protein
MVADVLIHWLLEIGGSGVWACLRGRCTHKHHRIMLDLLIALVAAAATVKILG